MTIAQALLPEFEHEMANTRKTLERVPMEKGDWKPHPKSGTLAWLANHVATIPMWGKTTLESESYDLAAGGKPPAPPKTAGDLVQRFDQEVSAMRHALTNTSDEKMMQPWSLKMGDQVIFTMPRIAVLRAMVMSHLIHHRGQLTVYLRMNEVPVPALFGPSADEK